MIADAENKQISVSDGNGTIGEYSYDGDGRRIKKYVPSTGELTVFVYDAGSKLIGEYSTVVQTGSSAKTVYTTNDHLGSPRINTDGVGTVISRHDYHPFGEEIARTGYGSDTIRKQFNGYERDGETGLDFAQARMFAYNQGRFTAPDPLMASARKSLPQTWNRYSYVLNNPLNLVDPTGMIWGYRDLKNGLTEYCYAEGKALCKGFKKYTGDGIIENPSIRRRELGYAIRLLPGGGWERVVPIDVQGQGRSWLSQKDIIAINAVSAGALCSLSGGFACPSSMDKEISGRVQTAGDIAQLPFLVKSLLAAGLSVAVIAVILRKDADDIAKIAAKVAGNFKNLECLECAQAMVKEFGKAGISGTIRELTSNGAPMVRAGQNTGEAISQSGRHFGVQVGETIYDLYHPQGIPVNDWKRAYESLNGVKLLPLKPQ